MTTIKETLEAARAAGLSYGEYVLRHEKPVQIETETEPPKATDLETAMLEDIKAGMSLTALSRKYDKGKVTICKMALKNDWPEIKSKAHRCPTDEEYRSALEQCATAAEAAKMLGVIPGTVCAWRRKQRRIKENESK